MDLNFLPQKDFSDDRAWKKAFDLALAVWRVSSFAPSFAKAAEGEKAAEDKSVFTDMSKEMLKRKLRKLASDIISELAAKKVFDDRPEEKSKLIFEAVRKIEGLRAHLRLVQNLKLTKEINCQVLDKEYRLLKEELLKEAIVIMRNKDIPFPSLREVPSGVEGRRIGIAASPAAPRNDNEIAALPAVARNDRIGAVARNDIFSLSLRGYSPKQSHLANTGNNGRLEKIVNYIKENKVVQLKEVLKFFPEYSEKTVRNDLKQLCGRNFIQRLGNGAGSCYKLVM